MSRLSKVTLVNFKGVKNLTIDLGSRLTIIAGANAIGKSTILDAVNYVINNRRLVDNGVGENDITSFQPYDLKMGEVTSVTLTFDNGSEFKKAYVCEYDKTAGKIIGHHSDVFINNSVCKNIKTFDNELMKEFEFTPTLTAYNEKLLMTDSLYAFSKMPNEAKGQGKLRGLLVDLGCNVTNEEVFGFGFDDLRGYEGKYRGDYQVMLTDITKQLLEKNKQLDSIQMVIASMSDVEEFDGTNLTQYEADKTALQRELDSLEENTDALGDLPVKLQEARFKLATLRKSRENQLATEMQQIEGLIAIEKMKIEASRKQHLDKTKKDREALDEDVKSYRLLRSTYDTEMFNLKNELEANVKQAEKEAEHERQVTLALASTIERKFDGEEFECPHCGEKFFDPKALDEFNKHKDADIKEFTTMKENASAHYQSIIKYCDSLYEKLQEAKKNKVDADTKLQDAMERLKTFDANLPTLDIDTTALDELTIKQEALNEYGIEPSAEENSLIDEVAKIVDEIDAIKENGEQATLKKKMDLRAKIDGLKANIDAEYIAKSKWATKQEWMDKQKECIKVVNDLSFLKQRVKDFVNTMVKMVNKKACDLTGMDFVMLEENLGDDKINTCCYVRKNGIKYDSLSTSEKIEIGAEFIGKIKDILERDFGVARNTFPVLADKIEGVDTNDHIRAITQEQMICTRVIDTTDKDLKITTYND